MSPWTWIIVASLCFAYYLWKSRKNTGVFLAQNTLCSKCSF
jgi:hypothetical protein